MTADHGQRWMLCRCLGEDYGLDLRQSQEIIYRPRLLALPGLEPPLCGMIIWQGRTLPVISLRLLAGRSEPPERPAVVIISDGRQEAGLLADDIGETVAAPTLFPLHPALSSGRGYISQAFMLRGAVVFTLDIDVLLQLLAPKTRGMPVPQS
jgi:chemotaxis signal transduction protein